MAFIGLEELLRYLKNAGILDFSDETVYLLYPVKAAFVGLALLLLWSRYSEIRLGDILKLPSTLVSVATGIVVFVLWINMDWPFATMGSPAGYDPTVFEGGPVRTGLILARLAGAVLIVPVMEELFWRSFLLRYIIKPDFIKVAVGEFAWGAFLITTVLFGLEHNLWLAGMMAGAAYNLLLYYTKSVTQTIIAHAATNLLLGIYVLHTGQWRFW